MAYREPELTLDHLDQTEALAFAALARAVVAADGRFDEEERAALQQIAAELGEDRFWRLMDEAAGEMRGREALEVLALRVERQAAREVIYGALMDLAIAGAIDPAEDAILTWLMGAWGLEPRDLDPA